MGEHARRTDAGEDVPPPLRLREDAPVPWNWNGAALVAMGNQFGAARSGNEWS